MISSWSFILQPSMLQHPSKYTDWSGFRTRIAWNMTQCIRLLPPSLGPIPWNTVTYSKYCTRRHITGDINLHIQRRQNLKCEDGINWWFCLLTVWRLTTHIWGRNAPLNSKRYILYIYSTNIGTEYFKHALYSPFFSLQNAVCFIMLACLVPVLFTFYI